MKVGILGLSKSGKTTVFEALTGLNLSSNLKDKFHISSVKVPDRRIDFLSKVFNPKKTTYPTIDFLDYNRLGEKEEKFIDQEYFGKLKECDGILKVIRNFENDIFPPHFGTLDPKKELVELDDHIILTDLEIVEKRFEKLKNAKYKLSTNEVSELNSLEKFKNILSEGKPLNRYDFSPDEEKLIKNYSLISAKKEIILINVSSMDEKINGELIEYLEKEKRDYFIVSALNEKELNEFDENTKKEFASEMKIKEFAIEKVISKFYKILNLITFLTVGEDEVRGWTIKDKTNAVKAAGKIHTDFEKGFIKAQVVSFDDFQKYGSLKECAKNGVLRLEGKDYIVKDGDIIEFKFNL
ncbi:MAG: DUF933 domain-containing protein [candidate division WOR-3 bacterium]